MSKRWVWWTWSATPARSAAGWEAVARAGLVGDLLMIPLEPGDYPI
ncbi:MAG TPA: hypothetical protein VND94_17710 [Terriglobia bacterium]|nr:hypothetical protein [Terriglobia bacterium]